MFYTYIIDIYRRIEDYSNNKMFYNNPEFQEKYYNFILKFFRFENSMKIVPIDFEKPWYKPLWDKKIGFGLDILSEIIQSVFSNLTPLIIGYIIYNQNYIVLAYFVTGVLAVEVMNRTFKKFRIINIMQIENSINYQAYRFFLTVDPIFHTTKSSGQIISKIERDSRSYGDLIDSFLENIYIIVSFLTVIITLFSFDFKLGLIASIAFILLAIVNTLVSFLNAKSLITKATKAKDAKASVTNENLAQNALIRSSFATTEQDQKTRKLTLEVMKVRTVAQFGSGIAVTINRFLFLIATILLSVTILNLINSNQLTTVTGVALIITFLNTSSSVLSVGFIARSFTEQYTEILDLFDFIRNFGKQTFPVLPDDNFKE